MQRQSVLWSLLFAFIHGIYAPAVGQRDPQIYLEYYLDKRDAYDAYASEVDYAMKWFSGDDTLKLHADIEFVRTPDDSLFGGLLYIELDSLIFAYDGLNLIRVDKKESTAETGDPVAHPGLWIASTWVNGFVEYGFLTRNQGFRTVLANAGIRTVVTDTSIGHLPCKGFFFYMPDEGEFVDQYAFVAIDTLEWMIRKRVTSIWFQGNEQYQSTTYLNPRYSTQTSIARLNNQFLAQYTMKEEYTSLPKDTSLKYRIDYSALEGKILGQDKAISLKDEKADVYILDFWYSACYPCIKSIPEVNKLHDRFKDRNVKVYGVNIIDKEANNKARIEKYLRNNPMHYETIMADGSLYGHWVQEGYPTLLILDKDLHLIQSHTGFSEHMAEELSAVIEKALKE